MATTARSITALLLVCLLHSPASFGDENETSYQAALAKAEAVSQKYRELPDDSAERQLLRSELQRLVQESFDLRQAQQQSKLEEMKKQFSKAEAIIAQRTSLRDRIIQRKVEDLLSKQEASWDSKASDSSEAFDVIAVGDTVAIVLDGILPSTTKNSKTKHPIPVSVLPSGHVVTGYPMVIGSDGAISLPYVDPIEIAGLSIRQAAEKIAKTYVDLDILRPVLARPSLTLVPKSEIANGPDESPTPSADPRSAPVVLREPKAITVQAGTPSFEDSYGRLQKAKSLAASLDQLAGGIQQYEQELALADKTKGATDEGRLRMLRSGVLALQKKVDTAKFDLKLQQQYLRDIVEDYKLDSATEKQLLDSFESKLESSTSLYKQGVLSFTDLQDVKADVTKQHAGAVDAQQKLSRYAKILERWNAIVGDRLDEPSEAEPADKANQ